jgi:RNA polymerase sigma factor (sigma-70 family)
MPGLAILTFLCPMPPGQPDNIPEIPATSGLMTAAEHSNWFRNEIHPHDGQLKTYLRGRFCSVRDIDDIVQESYVRVWKRHLLRPVIQAKAFLFAVARHLALDAIRHERSSPISPVSDLGNLNVYVDHPGHAETASTREEITLLLAAIERLSPRTREVYMLRKLQQVPQKEIAIMLRISPKTVEVHIGRANRCCEQFLRKNGVIRGAVS